MPEVILRDLDGTETVVTKESPLPEVIHTEESGSGEFVTARAYVRTAERDDEGRPVYAESNL